MSTLTDTKSKIESVAGRLLSQFDPGMYYDYSRKTKLLIENYREDLHRLTRIEIREDDLITGEKHQTFYITFNEPVYVTLTNPISMFRKKTGKGAGKKGDKHYFYDRALVPVFFASNNTMSMLKLYQIKAAKMFEPSGKFFEDMRCIELSHRKGYSHNNPVNLSSMNIIEQSTAKETLAEEKLGRLFYDKYFTLGFWLQPRRGYTPSTHFAFDKKMDAVFKLSKSIYTVDKLGEKETISILDNEIEVYDAQIRGVWVDTLQFGSPFDAKIESSVLEKIGIENSKSNILLNGILMEVRDTKNTGETNYKKIMTVCAGHPASYSDVMKIVFGMLCYKMCKDSGSVSFLSDLSYFKRLIKNFCDDWSRELQIKDESSQKNPNTFDVALEAVFPLVVTDESMVYYTNPLIIGFLKKWNLLVNYTAEQKKILLLLLPLLEEVADLPWTETQQIKKYGRFVALSEMVNKDPKFLASIVRLVYEINRSNLIRKTYQTEFSY